MDKHKLIRPKPKRELMVVIRVFNLPKFTENKKLDLVFGFINVDHPHSRLPSIDRIVIDRIVRVGAISGKPTRGRSIAGINMIVLFS